ncbi:replication initiation protein, partial [Sphingobacterium sp. IITKGP-BTPF85]|uniref:replication initiation protein n=1 Tax=Sphingobacterium sp. IITKGP-BTPF85 TaxID=1338009 RepID=UPI0012E00E04
MEIVEVNSDKLILQHNAITSGRYDFSACELDIMFMILANLKTGEDTYSIHISDIEAITGRSWNYQQLKEATEAMLSRVYQIETAEAFTQMVLFQYFDYIKGTGTVKVRLTEKAVPYFFDLKSNYLSFTSLKRYCLVLQNMQRELCPGMSVSSNGTKDSQSMSLKKCCSSQDQEMPEQ